MFDGNPPEKENFFHHRKTPFYSDTLKKKNAELTTNYVYICFEIMT